MSNKSLTFSKFASYRALSAALASSGRHLSRTSSLKNFEHKNGICWVANIEIIRILNKEIGNYFHEHKCCKVRGAASGGGKNLWKAVGLARDLNHEQIPSIVIRYKVYEKNSTQELG